jgi:hypothetical protein
VASVILAIVAVCWTCVDKRKEKKGQREQEELYNQELRATPKNGKPTAKPKTGESPEFIEEEEEADG